jgi:hypothetical protein
MKVQAAAMVKAEAIEGSVAVLAAGQQKMARQRKLFVKLHPFNALQPPRPHRNVLRQHRAKNPFALSVPKHRANGGSSNRDSNSLTAMNAMRFSARFDQL